MKKLRLFGWLALLAFVPQQALAGPAYLVQPIPAGAETVRFEQGVPTLDLEGPNGAVQVTPLPLDHGSLSFAIAVYNSGQAPANIDVSNIVVTTGEQQLAVFTREELESKAKNRAMWQSIALAAVGGLAAAAAASQRDTYRHTFVTPRGTYRSTYSAPSAAGQVAAVGLVAGTGVGIASIQKQLDETRAALGAEIVQTTTVDPGESYAGRIVVAKIKTKPKLPQKVSFVVNWNGHAYPFAFQLAKKGTPQPAFQALTPAPIEPAPAGEAEMTPAVARTI
jgi:hypothetical protein